MVLSETIPLPAADQASDRVASIFTSTPADPRVWIAHGYGIRVGVWNGQLEITDGIGKHRRTRRVPKADRQLRRLVVTGQEGYVTLAAMRWCRKHDVSVVVIDSAGDLVASHVAESVPAVKLLRAQALAGPDGPLGDKGVEISRYLLAIKLGGQSGNAFKLLDNPQVAMKIDHYAGMLADATTYNELNWLESHSADIYFRAWKAAHVRVPWPAKDKDTVPANWQAFERRKSLQTTSGQRNAIDPVNAMLNYAYMIGYAESRIACIGNSLDPRLGFMHGDSDVRDSLALDVLEAIRPDIDAFVLGMLGPGSEPYPFSRKLFREPDDLIPGTVRLVAPLTHEIAGQSMAWQDHLKENVRTVAGILGAPIGKTGRRSHNLTAQKAQFQNQVIDIDRILPTDVYETFKRLLPAERSRPYGGNPPISARNILAAMIYLEHHHKPWAHIPPAFGVSPGTLKNRRLEWKRLGVWDYIWSAVLDMAAKPIG